MRIIRKYIVFVWAIVFYCSVIQAQQGNSVLPSLINTGESGREDSISDINMLKKKMFVKVITSKHSVYVGEPVLVTYKFYVSTRLNDQPTVDKQPEFTGCSVKQLDFDQGPAFEIINNEPYAIYTIRKVQLTPLQPGLLSLGKAIVNNVVVVTDSKNAYSTKKHSLAIANDELNVEVKDLPPIIKPEDFYGITGFFTIKAFIKNPKVPMGESGHLIIAIKGSGNFDAIVKPEVSWPANIEHFDGTDSQHIDQGSFPATGERVFDIPFIGTKEEVLNIAPIRFSFFNTRSEQYETISTDSVRVIFTKSIPGNNKINEAVNDVTNRKYLWIVPAMAFVVACIGFISYKKNKKTEAKKAPATNTTVAPVFTAPQTTFRVKYRTDFSQYLAELESISTNKAFFTKAKDILIKVVAERVDSTAQYAEQVLLEELKQRTYNAPVCNKVASLLQAFNVNLYAPFETEADLRFYYSNLREVVETLQAES